MIEVKTGQRWKRSTSGKPIIEALIKLLRDELRRTIRRHFFGCPASTVVYLNREGRFQLILMDANCRPEHVIKLPQAPAHPGNIELAPDFVVREYREEVMEWMGRCAQTVEREAWHVETGGDPAGWL